MVDMAGATTNVFELPDGNWVYEIHHPTLPLRNGTCDEEWPFITGVADTRDEAVEYARMAAQAAAERPGPCSYNVAPRNHAPEYCCEDTAEGSEYCPTHQHATGEADNSDEPHWGNDD